MPVFWGLTTPNLVEEIQIERNQPPFGDLAVAHPEDAHRLPLNLAPGQLRRPTGELNHEVVGREDLAHVNLEGGPCERSAAPEIIHDLFDPGVIACDRAPARDVPDDVVGQELPQRLGVATAIKATLALVELTDDLLARQSRCSSPTTSPSSSPTFRTASNTPGMKDSRAIESWRIVSVCPSPPKTTSWCATRPGSLTL
jgi:hypothetical protein